MRRVGIDVGGTFTDVVTVENGEIKTYKTASTPENPAIGVGEGLEILVSDDPDAKRVQYIHHGTTVGTNALLEGKTALTALITTAGFRDVLEIGRQDRSSLYDLDFSRTDPVIPRGLRFTVPERINPEGKILKPLDTKALKQVCQNIPDSVESVAVSTLFSFTNPTHERTIKKYLQAHGFKEVTLSSEVLPEFREYERTSTTAINAALKPVFQEYLGQLERRAEELGTDGVWLVMQSNGGLIEPDTAENQPVRTILSGPAGGVKGSQFIAGLANIDDVLSLDMGGTSTDVCLIKDGEAAVTTDWSIKEHPVGVSSLDVHTIGAGGGSIAWVDEGGALRVGPKSAGADPGPACYSRGGESPTVTDAHLVLGRLDPDFPLADSLKLDKGAAKRAINREIAEPLDLNPSQAAQGILNVANSNMKKALRLVSVQQGHDPRDFVLLAYGGAGPLHATQLAADMSIPRVIIPPAAGVLSALGLLASNTRREFVYSILEDFDELPPGELSQQWMEAKDKASSNLETSSVEYQPSLDMRYKGQSYHLRIPVSGMRVARTDLHDAKKAFHQLHKRKYGHSRVNEPVEIVNQRLDVIGKIENLKLSTGIRGSTEKAYLGTRQVVFPSGTRETEIYQYERLGVGNSLAGPAIVHSRDSTITIMPGQEARINSEGALLIEV
ncbi:MAG: hydantoinase/oxoprolinase family protein [Candidatus Bipolaricaulota bacterium]